ncbi:permease-like cell division protein FtsX [Phytohabitans sp. LJ34]|uniref:permease-like cell division protein FtsX n=1 Tax=Phytohabitans sp. LJ34 TaxID=3452217 RepID=UPI003F8A4958
MRRVLALLPFVAAAALAACSAPAAAPPPPRPAVAAQPVQVVVLLRQDATAEQKQAIEAALRDEPGASGLRFMSAAQAFAELKRVYHGRPDTPRPETVPASYRLTLANQAAAEVAASRLRGLPGVEDVEIAPTPTPSPG